MKKLLLILIISLLSIYGISQDSIGYVNHGVPVHFEYYDIIFNNSYHQPAVATYRLTSDMLVQNVKRKTYYTDNIKELETFSKDYYSALRVDRGHLVPAADMAFNDTAMNECSVYANMTLQYPSFNRGIWKTLENKVRKFSNKYDTVNYPPTA